MCCNLYFYTCIYIYNHLYIYLLMNIFLKKGSLRFILYIYFFFFSYLSHISSFCQFFFFVFLSFPVQVHSCRKQKQNKRYVVDRWKLSGEARMPAKESVTQHIYIYIYFNNKKGGWQGGRKENNLFRSPSLPLRFYLHRSWEVYSRTSTHCINKCDNKQQINQKCLACFPLECTSPCKSNRDANSERRFRSCFCCCFCFCLFLSSLSLSNPLVLFLLPRPRSWKGKRFVMTSGKPVVFYYYVFFNNLDASTP